MNGRTPPSRNLSRRAALAGAAQALALLAAACTQVPRLEEPTQLPAPSPSPTPPAATPTSPAASATAAPIAAGTQASSCTAALPTVIPPTAIPYPGYVQVEPSTGLHVTAEPQILDVASYRLTVKGKVGRELSLTYDEIRCLPKAGAEVQIACPGFFIDKSNLAGASLASVLELAGPLEGAGQVNFAGVDGRRTQLTLDQAQSAENFLAYEWEGEALPRSHGFPVRAALPGQPGGAWIKWLQEIEVA